MTRTIRNALAALCLLATALPVAADDLQLNLRRRATASNGVVHAHHETATWDAKKTAIVVCDMWNQHWCKGATRRVGEMAPRMNDVIRAAREKGVFIIHAPSDTLDFYKDTEQRKRAQAAPKATPKVPLQNWCSLDKKREGDLPIDDSDGGCDCVPQCKNYKAWNRQIAAIDIAPEDAITDSAEAYNLLQQRGIDNVIVMGVHTNMCVLGRPFSIRQLVYQGKNVALMRDMTDTMYNPRKSPFVSHFRGTDLVVEHIEKHWCPTLTSADIIGDKPFRFSRDRRPHVVFMIGEKEYETRRTLPEFVHTELTPRGIRPIFVHVSKTDPNDFPGLVTALERADALFISVRRRTPPKKQLDAVRAFIAAGKPVLGIRTASHAFDRDPPTDGHGRWQKFDREIFGGHYQNHYGNKDGSTVVQATAGSEHPILTGIRRDAFKVTSHLYRGRDLADTTTTLLVGKLPAKNVTEPVAWINTPGDQKIFYTSLGNVDDFENPAFRRLLLNAVLWATGMEIPQQVAPLVESPLALGKK